MKYPKPKLKKYLVKVLTECEVKASSPKSITRKAAKREKDKCGAVLQTKSYSHFSDNSSHQPKGKVNKV